MARLYSACVALIALITLFQSTHAIKFELAGQTAEDGLPVCISQYIDADVDFVVKVKVGAGPHQKVGVEITDDTEHLNQIWKKDGLTEELQRAAFKSQYAGDIVACFTNVLTEGYKPGPHYTRTVDIDFDIGSETIDYQKLAEAEKLKPMEVELRKLEDMVKEIVENMEHLQEREEKMRNTNESTNARVQWFSTLTMVILVALGVWQIFYLKRFFRKKRLID
ncbi:vesicle coat component [Linnemannia zychae]|nr:vesicle coat component [Linnemannia zychae]